MITLDRAVVSRTRDGVTITDPESPWHVTVTVDAGTRVTGVTVTVAPGGPPVTPARLARLPLAQLAHLAAAELYGGGWPGEDAYRQLASPRPPRGADMTGHHDRVAMVAAWARDSGRPGGAAQAVADLWGITVRQAWRWLADATVRRP